MAYTIRVERSGDSGTLTYRDGAVNVATTCWWDKDNRIPGGTYDRCSATMMHSKNREGIFLPSVPGYRGIFIHKGTSAAWSDGCIVIAEHELLRIWNDINPKDGHNVTVVVTG